jgi:hypothetical protein
MRILLPIFVTAFASFSAVASYASDGSGSTGDRSSIDIPGLVGTTYHDSVSAAFADGGASILPSMKAPPITPSSKAPPAVPSAATGPLPAAIDSQTFYRMKDCSDGPSMKYAQTALNRISTELHFLQSASNAELGNCNSMWSSRVLGLPTADTASAPTCDVVVNFQDLNSLQSFAASAEISGSTKVVWAFYGQPGGRAVVQVCGQVNPN